MQLSSCQIYNVEKRIQEDHLQQLALFSEYGRMALNKEQEIATAGDDVAAGDGSAEDASAANIELVKLGGGSPAIKSGAAVGTEAVAIGFAAKAKANAEARRAAADTATAGAAAGGGVEDGAGKGADGVPVSQDWVERPFQRLEFLVRDWQVSQAL